MTQYQPELGQAIFGQPPQDLECPDWMLTVLQLVDEALDRHYEAEGSNMPDPFGNTGGHFSNKTFEVHAYDWSYMGADDPAEAATQPYNFKWRDVEVSWYKYLGRGMSINREVSFREGMTMLFECLRSLGVYGDDD